MTVLIDGYNKSGIKIIWLVFFCVKTETSMNITCRTESTNNIATYAY